VKLTGLLDESEITLGLGLIGMPGATAYGGLLDILRPNEGETIFISAASGAVGSLVGMLAKRLYNCKVIGSCGGPEKCALIKEKFGFDHAIDDKTLSSAEELTTVSSLFSASASVSSPCLSSALLPSLLIWSGLVLSRALEQAW
jgi:NADPH-dependent curcumin reductase CurA